MNQASTDTDENEKWIVPPGLQYYVRMFEAHYKASGNIPIMIVGDTGVGKSMFLEIFKHLLSQDKNYSIRQVVSANCAHFSARTSDPNIAKTELFGVGPNSGLTNMPSGGRSGYLQQANGGVLILEEVGELQAEVQAMLLTFLDTKRFYRVAGNTPESSNCRVIATTNDVSRLREDFKYRFFTFKVPSIYERRGDILYYLLYKYPELASLLKPWAILTLLAYNWPGNVREIERVGALIKANYEMLNILGKKDYAETISNIFFDRNNTILDWGKLFTLSDRVVNQLFFENNVEKYLNTFFLGIEPWNTINPLAEYINDKSIKLDTKLREQYNVKFLKDNRVLNKVLAGMFFYSAIFKKDIFDNSNLLEVDLDRVNLDNDIIQLTINFFKNNEGIYKYSTFQENFVMFRQLMKLLREKQASDVSAEKAPTIATIKTPKIKKRVDEQVALEVLKRHDYYVTPASIELGLTPNGLKHWIDKLEKAGTVIPKRPSGRPANNNRKK